MATTKRKKAAYTESHREETHQATRAQHQAFEHWRKEHAPETKAHGHEGDAHTKADAHASQQTGTSPTERHAIKRERLQSVKDIMTPRVVAVTSVTFLPEAAQIMKEEDVGALPVVQADGRLMGIITDRDITVRAVAEGRDITHMQVAEVFTAEDLVTVSPETGLREAEDLMAEHQVRRLPIVEQNNRLVGMVSLADVARELRANEVAGVIKEVSQPSGTHNQSNE